MRNQDNAAPAGHVTGAVRRFWWVVLVITLVAIGAGLASALNTSTTYTGRSSMIMSSNNRSPDQDAVLVQGYVDYFNNGAYQSQLLERAGVDESVSVTARAAASSPIMVVEVTSSSARSAQRAASDVASAFREDVNEERANEKAREVAELQARVDELLATPLVGSAYAAELLQERIAMVQVDHTNELQVLQLEGGVSTVTPDTTTNVLLAGLGGLLLGILAALALDRLFPRRGWARYRPSEDWAVTDELSTKV